MDHLLEGLVHYGLKPVRVGHIGKVKSSLLTHTLDSKLEIHPEAPKLQRVKEQHDRVVKRCNALAADIRRYRTKNTDRYAPCLRAMEIDVVILERQIQALDAKAYAIYLTMLREITTAADVVSGSSC